MRLYWNRAWPLFITTGTSEKERHRQQHLEQSAGREWYDMWPRHTKSCQEKQQQQDSDSSRDHGPAGFQFLPSDLENTFMLLKNTGWCYLANASLKTDDNCHRGKSNGCLTDNLNLIITAHSDMTLWHRDMGTVATSDSRQVSLGGMKQTRM